MIRSGLITWGVLWAWQESSRIPDVFQTLLRWFQQEGRVADWISCAIIPHQPRVQLQGILQLGPPREIKKIHQCEESLSFVPAVGTEMFLWRRSSAGENSQGFSLNWGDSQQAQGFSSQHLHKFCWWHCRVPLMENHQWCSFWCCWDPPGRRKWVIFIGWIHNSQGMGIFMLYFI